MATVPREEMIISKDYAKSCDYSWSAGLTEPLPSGIINIPIEHFYEFMEICHVASEMYANSFTYTLINNDDIEKTLDICV